VIPDKQTVVKKSGIVGVGVGSETPKGLMIEAPRQTAGFSARLTRS
jgi:hypothetical protein